MKMYTKGPWKMEEFQESYIKDKSAKRIHIFASMFDIASAHGDDWDTRKANARLIAAAPTMEIAIRSMLVNINLALKSGNDGYLRLAIEGGEAALAKTEKGE
jgi:hypothetical protein